MIRRPSYLVAACLLPALAGCAHRTPAPPAPAAPTRYTPPESVEARYRRIVAEREQQLGPRNPDVAAALHDLGRFLLAQQRAGDASAVLERVVSIREEAWGFDDPALLESIFDLGEAYLADARCVDAEAQFRRAITIADANDRSHSVEAGRGYCGLGHAVTCQGDLPEADRVFRRASDVTERGGGGTSALMVDILSARADIARRTEHPREAANLEKRAETLRRRLKLPPPSP